MRSDFSLVVLQTLSHQELNPFYIRPACCDPVMTKTKQDKSEISKKNVSLRLLNIIFVYLKFETIEQYLYSSSTLHTQAF